LVDQFDLKIEKFENDVKIKKEKIVEDVKDKNYYDFEEKRAYSKSIVKLK
jgi:hypothetical protein